ncbi:MAG TPA: DUF1007 family protein, partial [Thiolinea sp.]|nr:DUF1007 family protein [Thiolinea sp.]
MISLSKAHLQKVACLTTATALFSLANPLLADGYHYQIQAATKFLGNPVGELTSLKMDWTYDPDLTAALLEDEDLSEENKA